MSHVRHEADSGFAPPQIPTLVTHVFSDVPSSEDRYRAVERLSEYLLTPAEAARPLRDRLEDIETAAHNHEPIFVQERAKAGATGESVVAGVIVELRALGQGSGSWGGAGPGAVGSPLF